jgi:pilus assembly protein CpaB
VDVLLTRSLGGDEKTTAVTQVLAENVLVLGVDQSDNDEADKPVVAKAVTVEVTPDQAQTISLAQAVGTVSLALRRVADEAPLTRRATTLADLGITVPRPAGPAGPVRAAPRAAPPPPAPPPPPPPPEIQVRVIRGADTTVYSGTSEYSLAPGGAGRPAAPPAGQRQ